MISQWVFAFFVVMVATASVFAQESAPAEIGSAITYGAHVTGKLDNRTPREVFYFDGLRCEVVAVRLHRGDLTPLPRS
jgi:hypothetical protein